MHLARTLTVASVINRYGEVMMRKGEHQNSDIASIVLVCRVQMELGLGINYKGDGSCVMTSP